MVEELLAERGKTHGDYTMQAATACELRDVLFRGHMAHTLSAVQRDALNMIAVKLSRIVNGNPNEVDHWADLCGYSQLAADRCSK